MKIHTKKKVLNIFSHCLSSSSKYKCSGAQSVRLPKIIMIRTAKEDIVIFWTCSLSFIVHSFHQNLALKHYIKSEFIAHMWHTEMTVTNQGLQERIWDQNTKFNYLLIYQNMPSTEKIRLQQEESKISYGFRSDNKRSGQHPLEESHGYHTIRTYLCSESLLILLLMPWQVQRFFTWTPSLSLHLQYA